MSRIVIAIGGNALPSDPIKQEAALRKAAVALLPLIERQHEVVLVHGNGPQVGIMHEAFVRGHADGICPLIPYEICTAMNEGGIGYHLEQAIRNVLGVAHQDVDIGAITTRVVVNPKDPAFANPQKPVGAFYDEQTAKRLMATTGHKFIEDSGRGWRMAVPSPPAEHIVEAEVIRNLAASGQVVVAGGGAGVPVIETDRGYEGIEAVCDKDLTSAKIADLIDADTLLILTAENNVAINFGKPNQKWLTEITPEEAEKYIAEGQFPPGSMLPKVQACVNFVRDGTGRTAIIGGLEQAALAAQAKAGTIMRQKVVEASGSNGSQLKGYN